MNLELLKQKFLELHKGTKEDINVYFAPGRVNLIGEHVDYNGGCVFPCALSFGTYVLARKVKKDSISFSSENFDFKINILLKAIQEKIGDQWVNYPLGVINQFVEKGFEISGLQLLFSGDLPKGAGLSSSASIEMATAVMLNDLFQCDINKVGLVKMAQNAENKFVGVNCGIMDQFASGLGKKDSAIFLDCNTLDYEIVPINLDGYKLIISNTNKPRNLIDSKYNERRSECEKAVEYISVNHPIKFLGDLSLKEFNELKSEIKDDVITKRAYHVISEINRTELAVKVLKEGNIIRFGQLMNESHDSLRNYYEVTGFELDTLVNESRKVEGMIGSRMTGAGFGGCTVSVVKTAFVQKFIKQVGENYTLKTKLIPEFYIADISDGARKIE